jgi:hypothetical protein
MFKKTVSSFNIKGLYWLLLLCVLCSIFLALTLGIGNGVRLDVPFTYEEDGLEYNLLTKTMIETGWWLENPMVGAPGTLELYDYPIGSNLDFFLMKIISLISGNYAIVMNLYFILGFYLTSIACLYVFRKLGLDYIISIFGSLIFTFLFFHFDRLSIGHYNMTSYYVVPLMILVVLWLCKGESLFFTKGVNNKFSLTITKNGALSIFFLFLVATNSYYGFFGLLFLAVASMWTFTGPDKGTRFLNCICSLFLLLCFILINKLPTLVYDLINGPSLPLSHRFPQDSEIWGLKLIQMFIPAPGHRLQLFANISSEYLHYRPLVNENVGASLGIIGSIGLIILLGWIFLREYPFFRRQTDEKKNLMDYLSVLTYSAVMIGMIGGFSAIIAQVFPDIRSYNRISIFIAFFSIMTVMLILEFLSSNRVNSKCSQACFSIFLIIVLILGVFDQVPASYDLSSNSERETQFLSDDSYFKSIESSMSGGSQIFILPDIGGFPESNPPGTISHLESVKPYLHTTTLKWSYPTMKGRFWDNWQAMVASSPANEMLDALYLTNFTGLLIDGYGYADGGLKTASAFETVTGVKPLMSTDGRYSFFDLRGYIQKKGAGLSKNQIENSRDQYLNNVAMIPDLHDPGYATHVREEKLLQKPVISS